MENISVLDVDIEVVRKNIKNVHLRVYPPDGFVRVSVPAEMKTEAIRLFLVEKLGWIRKQQKAFRQTERQSSREFLQRESHYFLGDRYLLEVVEGFESQRVYLKNKKTLTIHLRPEASSSKAQDVMDVFYRTELKKIIAEYIPIWEEKIGVKVEEWQIRKMRTRWGTCNPEKKRIWLNLELAKKPSRCIEYIIVHEMMHLLERNHNEHFVNLMDTYLPNWPALRHELNNLPVSHADWNY
ncbi:MAG: SprT family zinc-dependent metalloprotease [Sphaerochaeta sp.]|nr:SprT family zinc-dependent metalloprotease [Sphaerochaeta sp.]